MADSDKNIRITTSKNKTTFPNIVFTGSSAGTSVLTLEVRDDNTVAFTGADGDVFSLDYNLTTGTIWSVNDKSGTPLLRASAGGTIGIAELGAGVIVGIGQTNPRYKLDVQGWVGFASTGDGSYTVLIENGLATGNNALSLRAANALRFYNSGNTLYTGFIGAQSGVNTTYILPPRTPTGTATSYLSSGIDGVMAWVAAPTSGGSGSVNSGTATYAAFYATTTNAVSENANLQFTGTGVSVGGTINSTSTTSGSLYVRGGVGITGNAFIGGTTNITSSQASISTASGALVVTGGVGIGGSLYTATSVPSSISGVVFNNAFISSGTWAGSTITAFYGGTGLQGPNAIGDIIVANSASTWSRYATSSTVGQVLTSNGTGSAPTWQNVPASAASSVAVAPTVVNSQFSITTVSAASGTGLGLSTISTFVVNPSNNIVSVSGFAVTASTASISTVTGALIVSGGAGIAGSLFTGTGTPSSISGVVHNNGAITATTFNRLTLTAPATSATLTLANGSTLATSGGNSLTFTTTANSSLTVPTAGTLTTTGNKLSDFALTTAADLRNVISEDTGTGSLVFATSPVFTTSVTTDSTSFNVFNATATTVNAFQAGTAISIGAATGTLTLNNATNLFNQSTATTSTTTGAIVVTGGVGVGQSVSIGGRLLLYNASTFTGFRSNQVGTGSTIYTLPTRTPESAVGTSVLSSTIDGVMSWVGMSAGGSGSPGGSNSQIQYNNGGAFGGATGMTWDNSNNLLTLSSTSTLTTSTQVALRIANIKNTFGAESILWSPALDIIGRSGVTPGFGSTYNNRFTTEVVPQGPSDYRAYQRTKYSYDLITGSPSYTNDIFRIHSTLGVGFGASNSTGNAISYFRVSTTQSGDVSYILPPGLPSTGTSVLQSDTSGTLSWVGIAAGGGSGTVNSGTGGSFVVYGTTGTAVVGTNLVTFAGLGVTVNGAVNASSTTVAALSVLGGLGITGNAFIGGTTNIINTTASLNNNSGALVVSGGAAIGGTLNVGNMVKVGSLNYAATNVLGAFSSSVDTFNQLIIQNTSTGTNASANLVVNNNQSTDTTFYGEIGMNSSNFSGSGALGAPNAVYVTSTSAPLVLGTTTAHPIRFVVNGGATDVMYISEAGTAISVFTNLGMRSQSDLRFWNSGNTFYAAIQGGGNTANYTMTLPTAPVAAGASVMVIGSDSNMYFAAPGAGIAFSSATANTPVIRARRSITMQFCAGYTPLAAGPDNVILKIPDSAQDGVTDITYVLREFDIRVETPSAGTSRVQLEKLTSTGAFVLGGTGYSMIGGFGITLTGAGTYFTSTSSFAAGALVTSNDKLRVNWTLLNATHANFSIQLTMQEV